MITAYKAVYLFGVAETGSEETGGLQGCAEALAVSKTRAGLARAVKDKQLHLVLFLQNMTLYRHKVVKKYWLCRKERKLGIGVTFIQ